MAKKEKPKKRHKLNAIVWLLVVLVLYIGVHVLSRTDGIRFYVADKISNGTRQLVSLDYCAATPLLGLRLKGLRFSGLEIADAKISINLLALFCQGAFRSTVRLLDRPAPFTYLPVPTTPRRGRACLFAPGGSSPAAVVWVGVYSGTSSQRGSTHSPP